MITSAANAGALAAAKIANAFEWPGQTSKIAPSPWDFITLPEEDRATAIGNMHRKIGNVLIQYFATDPVGEVTNKQNGGKKSI